MGFCAPILLLIVMVNSFLTLVGKPNKIAPTNFANYLKFIEISLQQFTPLGNVSLAYMQH